MERHTMDILRYWGGIFEASDGILEAYERARAIAQKSDEVSRISRISKVF